MKSILKWVGIVLGALVGLVVVAALVAVAMTTVRMNRTYDVPVEPVAIPTDAAALARGEHLVKAVTGCEGCHGENLGGMVLLDDPMIMTLSAPNLTTGKGGAAAEFDEADWVRAVRHGLAPNGTPLLLMPSQNFRWLSDEDLGAIVAYIRSQPPVDNQVPGNRLGPMGYFLTLTEPSVFPAELFDHAQPIQGAIEPGVTAEYGEYLVWLGTCRDCHGPDLNGRQLPLPGEPPSRNLTPGGQLVGWTDQDFVNTIRTGVNPGGETLREPMAGVLEIIRRQTDDELRAIFRYLQSLPPRDFGTP